MDESTYELIEKFYRGTLSPEEKKDFEHRLSTEKAFAAEVREYARLYQLLQHEGDRQLERKLQPLGKKLLGEYKDRLPSYTTPESKETTMLTFSKTLYIAAAVVGLLLIMLPFLLTNRGQENEGVAIEELYTDSFKLPPAPEARAEAIAPWKEAYMAGEYEKVIALLSARLSDSTYRYRSEAYLYLGASQMALKKPLEAIEVLHQVSESSFYYAEAQWLRSLALLQLGRADEAAELLQGIAEEANHPYQQKAAEIIDQLE